MNRTFFSIPNVACLPLLVIAVILFFGIPLMAAAYDAWYEDKIMPGVVLSGRDVGGLSREYITDIVNNYKERVRAEGVIFQFKGKSVTLYPEAIPLNSDIPTTASDLFFDINVEQTISALAAAGRTGSFLEQQRDRLTTALFKNHISPSVILFDERIREQLKKEFSFFHTPATDAQFSLDDGRIIITPDARGIEFDYQAALSSLKDQLTSLSLPTIVLIEGSTAPRITREDLEMLRARAEVMSTMPLHIQFEDTTLEPSKKRIWTIEKKTLLSWLIPVKGMDGTLDLAPHRETITTYLAEHIAPLVRIDVQHPRFEIKEGHVVAFDIPRNGRELDVNQTTDRIIAAMAKKEPSVTLAIRDVPSPYQSGDVNAVMIRELVSRAETDFSGSPTNRRKNIARGAALINGILIAPGETFSTIKALGNIDETNGFFPELVIKGTKTTPEFGGGLCQVSSTLFRAISFAGLEVIERRNHSYRVPYYEPPVGFDATIYDPAPDFKFKNDTSSHLLIQARAIGNKMIIELWGTKDGRIVEIDKPTVFNIKKAGEIKIIETDELTPGEKKCTERAHDGADALFERRITYADGTTKKELYKSHYVVWPAVCLIGKERESSHPNAQEDGESSQQPSSGRAPANISQEEQEVGLITE